MAIANHRLIAAVIPAQSQQDFLRGNGAAARQLGTFQSDLAVDGGVQLVVVQMDQKRIGAAARAVVKKNASRPGRDGRQWLRGCWLLVIT